MQQKSRSKKTIFMDLQLVIADPPPVVQNSEYTSTKHDEP
jgi:hypothetical protein